MKQLKVRLQKFMADCGVASRRRCEELIIQGQVRVNGQVTAILPVLIDPAKDQVMVGDEIVESLAPEALVYFVLHKPKGVLVTARDPADRKTVHELMKGVHERVFPVGRLDMDARGLVLMTNDGELANQLSHPRYAVEKTYIVTVDGRIDARGLEEMKKGMWLGPAYEGGKAEKTHGLKVKVLASDRRESVLEIKLTEAKNREIRRVLARIGYRVRDLFRAALAEKVTVKGLEPGAFRPLTEQELHWLQKVSSPDYSRRRLDATQKWYESKEMDKERKRLAADARKPVPQKPVARDTRKKVAGPRQSNGPWTPRGGQNSGHRRTSALDRTHKPFSRPKR